MDVEAILSRLNIGVFSCTPDGVFLDVDDATTVLLTREFSESEIRSLSDLFSDSQKASAFLQQVISSKEPQEIEFGPTLSSRIYRLNARLVTFDDEKRIDGLLEDVTQKRSASSAERRIAAHQISTLSPREKDVLNEVVAGHPNKLIARHLGISEKTVEKHRSNLMKKLSVRSVAELVRIALRAENT